MPSHAFLIGNWSFDHPDLVGGNLKYPENDIRQLRKALEGETLDEFNIGTCLNRTAVDLMEELGKFLEVPRPEELLIVYFSGHGIPISGRLCFATRDTNRKNQKKHVSCADFIDTIYRGKSQRVLLVLDCCYSGLAGRDLLEVRGTRELVEHTFQPLGFQDYAADATSKVLFYQDREREVRGGAFASKGIFLLTAAEALQEATGKPEDKLGLFTRNVIAGITGAALVRTAQTQKDEFGVITACSIFGHAIDKMRGEPQTPQIFVRGADAGDLLITRIHDLIPPHEERSPHGERSWTPWPESSIFNNLGPVYILGEGYTFVDWNASFQHLVATPFCLRRGDRVKVFLERLENWESEVKGHSVRQFPAGAEPDVDTEVLQFKHPTYGLIVARKFAARFRSDKRFWCVTLNPTFVQRGDLWSSLMKVVRTDAMWGRYAESYDTVISAFSENKKLVSKVVGQVGREPLRCLDVGAGTGSATIELLRQNSDRTVRAVEPNGKMVQQLRQNLEKANALDRVTISFADCLGALACEPEESFDACVMMNVLFAMDDPISSLRAIRRVLKWNGVLSLSTSTTDTNIDKLFEAIREEMSKQPNWDALRDQFEDALARNREMEGMITRYSEDDILRFLDASDFTLLNIERHWYVDCVVVIRAIKRKQEFHLPEVVSEGGSPA